MNILYKVCSFYVSDVFFGRLSGFEYEYFRSDIFYNFAIHQFIKIMKLIYIFIIALAITNNGCVSGNKNSKNKETVTENPLLKPSGLPYGVPDFTKIKDSDFKPAIIAGMEEHLAEVTKIVENAEPPTFENTLVALEKSGVLLDRSTGVFNFLSGANTNEDIQNIEEELAPQLAAHSDAIFLNDKLFKKIKTLYEKCSDLNLDPESAHLLDYYYKKFELKGANLPSADKTKLKKLNEEVATLSIRFSNQLLAAGKEAALVVDDVAKLDGLSNAEIQAAAQNDGKYMLSIKNTTQQEPLQSLTNREIRKQLFDCSWTRAEKGDKNDTRSIVSRITEICAEQANLMGFKNYAEWKLQDQMAKNPEAAISFMDRLIPAATAKAKEEAVKIQTMIDKSGGGFKLKPWDWNFYAEKVRKAEYDLDETQIKPYLLLDNVLQKGAFYAASKLYGIVMKERKDIPVYQEDVRVFEMFEENGTAIGLFYFDPFKRDNKSGGAWMGNIVEQSKLLNDKPVIYNVCNFPKPPEGSPALISFDDVTTLFHEFGHALHGFFADQQYPSLSGTNVARDFVELPSQFMEHWAIYPEVFNNYAIHYETGKTMPAELFEKIKKSSTFNQGYSLTEILAAARLDMEIYTLTAGQSMGDPVEFEERALKKTGVYLEEVPPRYRTTYFLHIWGHGYAAGYYAYLWAEMLDNDAYAWFEENGGLKRENGQRFRDMILSRGNTGDYEAMYLKFRGRQPDIKPMLKHRGL